MNTFFRICVAVYSFISMVIFAIIAISPFGDKTIMARILDFLEINVYQSNKYDVVIFLIGLVFFLISISVLTSGIRGKKSVKYYTAATKQGEFRISSTSVENIALGMAKRFQGVKDCRAKAEFVGEFVRLSIKVQVYTDVNIPSLCAGIQERIKESVENSTEIKVQSIIVSVDGVQNNE